MADSAVIRRLERRIERLEESRPAGGGDGEAAATGIAPLDELLPRGGLPRGEAVEWLGPRSCGKTALLRAAFARLRAGGESVAVVDARRTLYAPDWAPLVGEDDGLWTVRPSAPGEARWCADLLLRSGAFGGVALLPGGEPPPAPAGAGGGAPAGRASRRRGGGPALGRAAVVRLQRLAEEAGAIFVAVGRLPVAALRLRFRPGRVEPVGRRLFGPRVPRVRPLWVRVARGGEREVPVLCPDPPRRSCPARGRDRKGRR